MSDNIVKTEVILSEESVHKIVVSETAKALASIPKLMETMVNDVLFFRPPKRNSYDKPNKTFYETVIQGTLKPMIEDEVRKLAQKERKKLSAVIKKAFNSNVINNEDFEKRLIEQLSKFASNISFYVSDD